MDITVTTASKKPQTMSQSPAAVYVIERRDIERYGYRTLSDALRSVAGFYTLSDRSYDYVGVRGFLRSGDYNSRILLLVNGHKINDPLYDMAPIGEDFPIDIEAIDRIEVVKGPGSSIWGANALLAVVNVITRSVDDAAGGRLGLASDKVFGEYGAEAGEVGIVCSASATRTEGDRRIYFPEFDAPETNNGIAVGMDDTDATHGYLAADYRNLKLIYCRGTRKKEIPTASYGTIFNDPRNKLRDSRSVFELSYESQGVSQNSRSISSRVWCDEYRYIGDYIYDYPPVTLNRDNYLAKWWGAELKLYQPIGQNLSLTCGSEYARAYDLVEDNHDVSPYVQYSLRKSARTAKSLYVQADYRFSDKIALTVGNRYDSFSTFGSTWSPKAALIYVPKDGTHIKALYGSAFRPPNNYEMSWQDPNLPATQPEKMETNELVWEHQIGDNSRLVTSLFRYDLRDAITFESIGDTWRIVNRGSARSSGLETQFETRSANDIRGYVGLSISKSTFDGARSPASPPYTVTSGVSIPICSHRYVVSPQLRSTGRLLAANGAVAAGAATVVDLVASSGRDSNAQITLGIYDLFGCTAYMPGTADMIQARVPQSGRTVRLQVSRQF